MRISGTSNNVRYFWVFLLLSIATRHCVAHLGEEHPPGEHDYFPDFPLSPLSDDIYITSVLNVHGARDLVQIPDGTGRFLAMRGINHVKITQPGQKSERLYVATGSLDIEGLEGAVSVELHPGFAIEGDPGYGKFYTVSVEREPTMDPDFTSAKQGIAMHSLVTEWTTTDITAPRFEGTRRDVMRFHQGNRFHNVNDLAFGPDGYLYIALGEDNEGSQAESLGSVYGKILRIDPAGSDGVNGAYGIPPDNPFVGQENAAPEVFAYGMRNPWRINFDRETGALFAADVGFDSIEEIDLIEAGKNYGWPKKEGSFIARREATPDLPNPITGLTIAETFDLTEPLFEIDQTDTNSIIGGVAYRGERFPELVGKYIFGSWNNGNLFVGDPATGQIELLMESGRVQEFMNGERYVSINEDLDGEIYLVGGWSIRALFAYPDFNDSDSYDTADADAICDAFGSESSVHDLNGDLTVDLDDINVLLDFANTLPGDLDLDGTVDFADFVQLSRNYQRSDVRWSDGDLNCDNVIGFADFVIASGNYGKTPGDVASVPEPNGGPWMSLVIAGVLALARKRRIGTPPALTARQTAIF